MEDKEIQSILQDVLEEEIPPAEINLWPAVKADLVAGKYQSIQQGAEMKVKRTQRIWRLVFVGLIGLTFLVLAFATPQGRSIAQSVLRFFVPTESTTFPLEPEQIATGEPDQSEPTALPPSPLISIEEAEKIVGFNALELPLVPDGYNYLGTRLYGDMISIEYAVPGNGGHLSIHQSPSGYNQSEWDRVPAYAIVPVKIGELDGEFTQGMFVVYAGDTSAIWNPDAPILRLRWVKDGIWFEMTKFGDVEVTEYLDQEGLVELAESLVP